MLTVLNILTQDEISTLRRLAGLIRERKQNAGDAITWDHAIEQVIREYVPDEDGFFRTRALMDFFLNEGKQRRMSLAIKPFSSLFGTNEALERFLEGLDGRIAELKENAGGYLITEAEQRAIGERIDACLARLGEPRDMDSAFDYYQLLIDRIFISDTIEILLSRIMDLSMVLDRHYPDTFPEVQAWGRVASRWPALAAVSANEATKKELAAHLDLNPDDIGLVMARLAQIGIVEIRKRGRENLYRFTDIDLDVNRLRKEWTWLWAQPYKRLSLKLYDNLRDFNERGF